MSEFKGSRGLLEVHSFESESGKVIYTVVEHGAVVANVGWGSMYPGVGAEDVMKANAGLFAAAPEILSALQSLLSAAKSWNEIAYSTKYGAIRQAEAAIKKALGQ